MARRVLSWAVVAVLAWTVSPAVAQTDSPLKALPGKAAVVLRVKGLQGTLNKIAGLADAVSPGSGNTVKLGAGFLGAGIKNPTMEGVDQAGDFYVAVFVEKNAVPGIVFAIPGKNLGDMQDALGEDVAFLKQGKHGIYSDDEELIDAVKAQASSKDKTSLADTIDVKSRDVLAAGDISVFVNVPVLLQVYQDEFEMIKGQAAGIKDQEFPGEAPPNINAPAMMEQFQKLATSALQAVEDHEGISIALTFTDKEFVIEEFFKLKPDSVSGKALKAGKSTEASLLTSLPQNSPVYYAVQGNLSNFMSWGLDFARTVMNDEKSDAALAAMSTEFKSMKFAGLAGAVNLTQSESGILNMVNVIVVDKPAKVRDLAHKYADTMKAVEANGTKTEVSLKKDAEKIGANSIDVMTAKMTITDDAPNADQQRAVMDLLYGESGAETRSAYLKDKIVQSTGGGKAAMEAALKAAETPVRTLPASIEAVRAKLGAKPCFIGLADIANLAVKGLGISSKTQGSPLPFDVEKVTEGLEIAPSFTGFGVEVQDAAVSLKTVVPVDQMKGIGQLVKKIMEVQQGEE